MVCKFKWKKNRLKWTSVRVFFSFHIIVFIHTGSIQNEIPLLTQIYLYFRWRNWLKSGGLKMGYWGINQENTNDLPKWIKTQPKSLNDELIDARYAETTWVNNLSCNLMSICCMCLIVFSVGVCFFLLPIIRIVTFSFVYLWLPFFYLLLTIFLRYLFFDQNSKRPKNEPYFVAEIKAKTCEWEVVWNLFWKFYLLFFD